MRNIPFVTLPYSKSIGARYLTASFFAGTLSGVEKLTDSDDLTVIQQALLSVESSVNDGNHGPDAGNTPMIDVHASGTAFRIMSGVIASTPGADFILTGTPRLCARPMTPLLGVLRKAGADITASGDNGEGPYHIIGRKLKGGRYEIRGDVSSQFITSLMLAAPQWEGGMQLHFTTRLVSRPYIEMTARLMEKFGIKVSLDDESVTVEEGRYTSPENFPLEADWSAAGFIYEAVSFTHKTFGISRVLPPEDSLQGDSATAGIFRKMGVVSEFSDKGVAIERYYDLPDELQLDLSDNPDLVPALAVACLFNAVRFKFTGVGNLRLKECDRLAALQTEFAKFGYPVDVDDDSIGWAGGCWPMPSHVVETYDDHRIAMAFAIAALQHKRMIIANPDVVEKSFAGFWDQLPKIGLICSREGDVMIVENESWLLEQELLDMKKNKS